MEYFSRVGKHLTKGMKRKDFNEVLEHLLLIAYYRDLQQNKELSNCNNS